MLGRTSCVLVAMLGGFSANACEMCSPLYDHPGSVVIERMNDWVLADGQLRFALTGSVVYGESSGRVGELNPGGHDPAGEGFGVQSLEPAIVYQPHPNLAVCANALWFTNGAGEWKFETEEAFAAIKKLPGGMDLRVGQIFNRTGISNVEHLHAWNQIDAPLMQSRLLGDDGIITRSAEVTWHVPTRDPYKYVPAVHLAYGGVRPHEEHEHEHEHGESGVEFGGRVFSARVAGRIHADDFHSAGFGISYLCGENEAGGNNRVAGVDAEFLWRENGRAIGGRALRLRGELMVRHVEWAGDGVDEFGGYLSAVYSLNEYWDTGVRVDYVGGIAELGLERRARLAPCVTFYTDQTRRFSLRAQYNIETVSPRQTEHSVWLQAGFQLGANAHVE